MVATLIDWYKIFEEEDHHRTAVIVTPGYTDFAWLTSPAHCDQYGIVETMRHNNEFFGEKSYLVIQFKDAADATDLISKGSIVVRGIAFIVIPFHSNDELTRMLEEMVSPHPRYYAPPAPDRYDENILTVLNDDCLGEIFRRIDELIPIENVCTRFKRVAQIAFTSVYRKKTVQFYQLDPNGNVTLKQIEFFLRRFGPLVVKVILAECDYTHLPDRLNSILKLMTKYCTNLKNLFLSFDHDGVGIKDQTLVEIRPLLSKLNIFTICHKSLSECNGFIAPCAEIEKLSVVVSRIDSVVPAINFPKLKSCDFNRVENSFLDGFMAKNPQIEKLKIPYEISVVRSVAETVPNLRKLTITGLQPPFTGLEMLQLKRLKETKIFAYWRNFELMLGESMENLLKITNITDLQLKHNNFINFNHIVALTKHLYNLETLEIRLFSVDEQILSMDVLKEMLQHAKKLRILQMVEKIIHHFCEKDYDEILQIIRNRGNPIKLYIELRNHRIESEDKWPPYIQKHFFLNTDPQWLTIKNCYDSQ